MTVLSFQRLAAWPRRRAALPRHLRRAARRPPRPAYHDPFFADPAVVEDDARRLGSARPG
jgi:hypothetical protein